MGKVTLEVRGCQLEFDPKFIPEISSSTKTKIEDFLKIKFPVADQDSEISEDSLKVSVEKLYNLGSRLKKWQQTVLGVAAIAGVILMGVGAFAALFFAALLSGTKLAMASGACGFVSTSLSSWILYRDERREPLRNAVNDLFVKTMTFFCLHGENLATAIKGGELNTLEVEGNLEVGSFEHKLENNYKFTALSKILLEVQSNVKYFKLIQARMLG